MTARTTKYIETVYIFSNFITRVRENDCFTNSVSREYRQNDKIIIYHRRSYVPELPTRCAVQRVFDLFHKRFLSKSIISMDFLNEIFHKSVPFNFDVDRSKFKGRLIFAFSCALFSNAFRTRNSTDAIDRIF